MKKIIIAIVGSVVALSLFIIISSRNNQQPVSTNLNKFQSISAMPSPAIKLNTYVDSSGFSFQYPKNLVISNVIPLGNSYYADLTATASGKIGKATLTIESTIVKSLSDFKKTNKDIPQNAALTKLADLKALEYDITNSHLTIAIDEGTLITIATPLKDKSFWDPIHKIIVSSFKFVQPTVAPSSTTSSSDDSDVTFEGEETIE